jgi:peptidoglycan/xylan/chitin deacetylase (PgdA/CDA1 family)
VSAAVWPGGARGALSLTFDNLNDPSAAAAVPGLLEELGSRRLAATFFAEGLNVEVRPELLVEIDSAGHEVAYHAWRHEHWAGLSPAEQAENLARGRAAFEGLGLDLAGMRPPGGGLGPDGLGALRDAGLRYCSPAGSGAGEDGGVALLPFRWRDVDASSLLPGLESVREEVSGRSEALDPATFVAALEAELERLAAGGGYLAVVLHLALLDWLGAERLADLLDRIAAATAAGELWVATCAAAADHVLDEPGEFAGATELDPRTWSG